MQHRVVLLRGPQVEIEQRPDVVEEVDRQRALVF
jgi:hypothetical protein